MQHLFLSHNSCYCSDNFHVECQELDNHLLCSYPFVEIFHSQLMKGMFFLKRGQMRWLMFK